MWTPKRIVLLVCTFGLFLVSYRIYGHFLGGIDGLPPLPVDYWPTRGSGDVPPPQAPNLVDRKLSMAFGEECPELDFAIKLEAHLKGVVLASRACSFEDGRLRLEPISLALFNKKAPAGKFPEITTVRGAVAYITFDRPVSNLTEIDKRRIIGCELIGKVKTNEPGKEIGNGIEVVHNRGTLGRDDDVCINIPRGPVFYREFQPQNLKPERPPEIWSDDAVKMTDYQSKPQPTTVKATGIDIFLTNDPQAARNNPPARKPRPDQVTGIERLILRSGVEMHLFVDSRSGFLSPSKAAADEPARKPAPSPLPLSPAAGERGRGEGVPARPPEKSQLVITTQGPFTYDVIQDVATFAIPRNPGGQFPEQVCVNRIQEQDKPDHLICEHLVLHFRRKAPPSRPAPAPGKDGMAAGSVPAVEPDRDRSRDLEIETAHATGQQVVLTSNIEMLEAHGNDFFYNALTQQTTLKGDPEMWALKEGNEIHARELQITNQAGAQSATAIGPGRIDMLDKQTGKRPLHARWRDKLVTTRDGKHDLLTLTGDAAFIDDEQGQELRADTLKVWLDPDERSKSSAPATEPEKKTSTSRRPHHLEAIGQVDARSPELTIHHTDRLVLWFKDSPGPIVVPAPPGTNGPGSPPVPESEMPGHSVNKPAEVEIPGLPRAIPGTTSPVVPPPTPRTAPPGLPIPPTEPGPSASKPAAGKPPAPAKPSRPLDLSARFVEAHLIRTGEKNELDRLWTEGTVRVKQAGATPADRGTDIKGDTLQLTHTPEGNIVVVTGNDVAEVQMDRMLILGPVVNIDQAANKAWVSGSGAMRMESNTSFQGTKLKEPVLLTILWNESMFFNGEFAEFQGGIQAEQENARLTCQTLTARFDQPISLKENSKPAGRPPAKVQRLVCDKSVRVYDSVVQNGNLLKYQQIDAPWLTMDNTEGRMNASGPGIVRILQPGAAEGPGAPGAPNRPVANKAPAAGGAAAAPPKEELKLTRVRYDGSMYANNNTHTAIFYSNVEVVHVPVTEWLKTYPTGDPGALLALAQIEPNVDRLPEGGMYIRCDQLKVYSRQEGDKAVQEMEARGKTVVVRGKDFSADAAVVHYHEGKDQLILDGEKGLVRLLRQLRPGEAPQETLAQKIIYSRKTGHFDFIGVRGARGQ